MISEEEDIFSITGPTHLTSVNWGCQDHRRSIAASLVKGVYVLEADRQLNRLGSASLAPPWWEFFHFELLRKLVDDADLSIFGAIYKSKLPSSTSPHHPPTFVVAFRGTVPRLESFSRDLSLDLQFIQNGLHQTSRSEIALQAVRNVVSVSPSSNIWLAGHSLGSAVATLAGKNMAKRGVLLETFLFNPPFFSAPLERIRNRRVKKGLRIAVSAVTVGLALAVGSQRRNSTENDSFSLLSTWIPRLFVNRDDHICSEYIGYFEHRRHMDEMGAGIIESVATQNSIGDLVLRAFGKESEPLHLFPSANVTVNVGRSPSFRWAHGIHQWWRPDLRLESKLYRLC